MNFLKRQIIKALDYLADKVASQVKLNETVKTAVDLGSVAITDKMSTLSSEIKHIDLKIEALNRRREVISISDTELLVKTDYGGWLLVPSYNIDVGIGVVRDGGIEPWTKALVGSILKPHDTYVNIGANFGYYVCYAAALVGRQGKVVAFEPNPYVMNYLHRSVYWSGFPDIVELYLLAAYDSKCYLDFGFNPHYMGNGNVFARGRKPDFQSCLINSSTLTEIVNPKGRIIIGDHPGTFPFRVQADSLDNIFKDRGGDTVKLLHIDVEGAEAFVLKGAKEVLENNPAMHIICEFDPKTLTDERKDLVVSTFQSLVDLQGYTAYRVAPEIWNGSNPPLEKIDIKNLSQLPHGDLYFEPKGEIL